jgi:sirohydrochlorin ferrochelatase
VLLAVAHGSRDPAAAEAVLGLTAQVAGLAPGVDVRTAFIELAQPDLTTALAAAVRDAGDVVIVPLLLSAGYHVRHDIAGAAASVAVTTAATHVAALARMGGIGRAGRVRVAAPLGPDARLVPALADRLAEAGAPRGTPIVLAAAGSCDPQAVADTQRQAELLAGHLGVPVVAAYLSASQPTVDEAMAVLATRTGSPVAVATYLLAPGLFYDRLRRSKAAWVSAPLAGHPAVADLVLHRHQAEAPVCGRTGS